MGKSAGELFLENRRSGKAGKRSAGQVFLDNRKLKREEEEKEKRKSLIQSRLGEQNTDRNKNLLENIGGTTIPHSWETKRSTYAMNKETLEKNAVDTIKSNPAVKKELTPDRITMGKASDYQKAKRNSWKNVLKENEAKNGKTWNENIGGFYTAPTDLESTEKLLSELEDEKTPSQRVSVFNTVNVGGTRADKVNDEYDSAYEMYKYYIEKAADNDIFESFSPLGERSADEKKIANTGNRELTYDMKDIDRRIASSNMTDNEKKVYQYLYKNRGKQEAEEYLNSLGVYDRAGEDLAKTWDDSGVAGKYLGLGILGLGNAAEDMKVAFDSLKGKDSHNISGKAAGYVLDDLNEYGPKIGGYSLGRVGGDIIFNTANMVPSMMLGSAGGAAGETFGKVAGAASMGMQSYGGGYEEGRTDGKNRRDSMTYGSLVGASEAGLSYLLSGISSLGGSVTGNVVKHTVDKIDNVLLKVAANGAINSAGEFTEEYLQEILTPVFRNICFDENNEIKPFTEEALYAGILGALTSGVLEGPSTAAESIYTIKSGKELIQEGVAGDLQLLALGSKDSYIRALGAKDKINASEAWRIYETLQEDGADLSQIDGYINFKRAMRSQEKEEAKKNKNDVPENMQNTAPAEQNTVKTAENAFEGGNIRATEQNVPAGGISQKYTSAGEVSLKGVMPDLHNASAEYGGKKTEIKNISKITGDDVILETSSGESVLMSDVNFDSSVASALYSLAAEQENELLAGAILDGMNANPDVEPGTLKRIVNKYKTAGMSRTDLNKVSGMMKTDSRQFNVPVSVMNTAYDGGVELQKTYSSNAQREVIRKIAEADSYKVEFYRDEGGKSNGYYKDGTIYINESAENPALVVMSHELTHYLKEQNPEGYNTLESFIMDYMQDKDVDGLNQRLDDIWGRYIVEDKEFNREDAIEEVIANACSEFLLDEQVVKELISKDRTLGEKILDAIKNLLNTIKKELAGYKYNSYEAVALRQEEAVLEKAKELWVKGLKEARKAEQVAQESRAKLMLKGYEGDVEVYETSEETKKLTYAERKKKIISEYKEFFVGKTARFEKNGEVYYAQLNKKGLHKGIYGDKKSDRKGFDAKINIGADGNYIDLVEHSLYSGSSREQGKTTDNGFHKDAVSWDYYLKTIKSDGMYFDVLVNVKDTGNNQYLYDVTLKENTKKEAPHPNDNVLKSDAHATFDKSVSEKNTSVKDSGTKSSLKETITDIQNPDYYTYENLSNLPDVQVGSLEGVKNRQVKEAPADVVSDAIDNIRAYNEGKNDLGEKYLHNDSLNRDVRIVKNSLRHTRKFGDKSHKEMILSIPTFFESMVVVNEGAGVRNKADRSYVLLGAFEDSDGNGHIVRSVVNSYDSELRVDDTQIVYSMVSKKEAAKPDIESSSQTGAYLHSDSTASNVTIAELLEKVKGTTYKNILPENVLNKLGVERESEDLLEGLKYSLTPSGNSFLEEDYIVESIKNASEGRGEIGELSEEECRQIAISFIKQYDSSYKLDTLTEQIKGYFDYVKNNPDENMEDLVLQAADILKPVLRKSRKMDYRLREEYAPMLEFFAKEGLSLNGTQQQDIELMFSMDYDTFRKKNLGRFLLKENGKMLSEVWPELCNEYPEFFSPTASPTEQVLEVMDAIETVQPRLRSDVGYDLEKTAVDRALAMYGKALKIKEDRTKNADSYADKIYANLKANRTQSKSLFQKTYKQLLDEQRMSQMKQEINREKEDLRRKYDSRYEKLRQDNIDLINERTMARMNDRRKLRERNEMREHRERIKKNSKLLMNWLEKPSEARHVPEDLRGVIAEALKNVDFISKKADPNSQESLRWQKRMNTLSDILQDMQNGNVSWTDEKGNLRSESYFLEIDEALPGKIKNYAQRHENLKKISDMTVDDLKELDEIVGGIRKAVIEANKLRANASAKTVQELGRKTVKDLKGKKERKGQGNSLVNMLRLDMMDPITFFEELGEGGKSVFNALVKGQDKRIWLMKDAMEATQNIMKEHNIDSKKMRELTKEAHKITIGDQIIYMTKAQMMSMYLLGKRNQAAGHMKGSGFQVESVTAKRKGNKAAYPIIQNKTFKINDYWINRISQEMLTQEERNLADGLQQFLANDCARWGNEISQELFEYDKYTEADYFPIHTAKDFNRTKDGNSLNSDTSLYRLRNPGFSKNLQEKANNPIVIRNIFDVYTEHVEQMASYNALSIPVNDALKWYNYCGMETSNYDFGEGGKSGSAEFSSVKNELKRIYGQDSWKYVEGLLKDINGAGSSDAIAMNKVAGKLTSKFKVASVAGNLRVVIQQPTAIFRILEMVDGKYLLKSRIRDAKEGMKMAQKYCAIALHKSWGFYDTDLGTGMKDVLFGTQGVLGKAKEASLAPAGWADDVTWGIIWNVLEAETADKTSLTGEELYRATAERMTEVVMKTQVVDSLLTKSPAIRSKNWLVKTEMTFMNEPVKTYNMLYRAFQKVTENPKSKSARANLGRIAVVYGINAMACALAQSLIDAGRDDDETYTYMEKFGSYVWENFLDNMNPLSLVPFGKDVLNMVQGYDSERTELTAFSNIINGAQSIQKWLEDGNAWTEWYKKFITFLTGVSQLTGIPLSSITREFKSIVNLIYRCATGRNAIETQNATYKDKYERLAEAYDNNDTETINRLENWLLDQGKTRKEIKKGVEKARKEKDS